MNDFRLPLGDGATAVVDFITRFLRPVFDAVRTVVQGLFDATDWVLTSPPFWVVILVIVAIGLLTRGWLFGIGTAVGLVLIVGVDQWENAMDTLALVLVAAVIAILLSVPLGILAARSRTASAIVRPVLDFIQTMPAFVYLIPALILFRVGVVPGIVATIVFAMAPGVRLTELGIRGVDQEVVEAGSAFGASRWRILRQIQLPLAAPSILAGVNQVIMLSLSMVVIAGMVGAGGLGQVIVQALSRVDVGLGFEAGLAVVILAIILDRITASLGNRRTPRQRMPRIRTKGNPMKKTPTTSAPGTTSGTASGTASAPASKKRVLAPLALGAATVLALSACTAGSADEALENGDGKNLTVAVFNGWPEGEAASYLWKHVLEEKGYDVEFEYADAGPVFAGLSTGDYDVAFDGWLPTTHQTYLDRYGDDLVDLGAWNDEASLTIAVNEDAPIDSLDELAANADAFGNRIVGIEPGAGLTEQTQNEVIPGYGLDDMEYLTSSTPAMLAELTAAVDAGENIAVTLWRPHWAYDEFPLKDLADPQGALGSAESIHSIGSASFEEEFPVLAGWVKDFSLDSEKLYSLENAMFNEGSEDDYDEIVERWSTENQEYVDGLTAS